MNQLLSWVWAPFIALQFLTRLPVTFVPAWVYAGGLGQRRSLVFFPAVGIVTGGVVALAIAAARALALPPVAAAAIGVGAGALLTGCFHEDGLADTADAMGVPGRDDALRVMRDSRIGTYGAVALWFLLTVKTGLLSMMPTPALAALLISAHALGRWSSLPLAMALPYAREGSGLGAGIASMISPVEVALGTIVMVLIVYAALGFDEALIMIGVSILVLALSGMFFRYRFGGVTGDCLGAANQAIELAVLIVGVAAQATLFRPL
ncbi:MAG: adenosylcobinamide-GDP ribazoletransferase [Capsulimonadaceae bacterium]|nr:adenosylcobinamide-GDP ribazoletransferase [Capsulimonadaceae bacterium]